MKQTLSEIVPGPGAEQAVRAGKLPGHLPAPVVSVGLQVISITLIFALWGLISFIVSVDIVPTPLMTWHAFLRALAEGSVWSDMAVTFKRTIGAFVLAMVLGIAYGALLGSVYWFNRVFAAWLTIGASIPSLLFIVVSYLTFGLNDTAAIIGAGLVVAPSITFNVWQGMKSLNPELSEMTRAFGLPRRTIFWRVIMPQTIPFLFAAARSGLALTWKIIIFVELLGRPSGVGYRIQFWYQLFNMERVLAAALPFIILMLLIELLGLQNLEKFLFRWRREEAR